LQRRSTEKFSEERYGGVGLWDKNRNPGLILVYFSLSITSTKLWESNYSDYQEKLYNRIKGYIENSVTPIGYRRISKIFNEEGLNTPRGTSFSNSKVHSMYKKGLIREERMNRKDIVDVSPVTIELIIHPILGRIRRSSYEKRFTQKL